MTISHSIKYLKYSLIILVIYNIISLLVLFLPFKSLKYSIWSMMPYDYKYLINFPTNQKDLSLLNSTNRDKIKEGLNKNSSRNALSINYWNYNLIIDNYSKNQNNNFERTFINLFYLSKNNRNKQLDLKKYFISNFYLFSKNNQKKILEDYK